MSSDYQPLFNRTYLKVLPLIVAVAILLLNLGNQEASFHTEIAPSVYTLEQPADAAALTLVYPLPEHFSADQQTTLQALTRIQLPDWLGNVVWQPDRVTITWPSLPDSLLNSLDELVEQLDSQLTHAHAEAVARAYLQPADEKLLSRFLTTLSQNSTPITAKRLFSVSPLVLLNPEKVDTDSEALATLLSTLRQRYPAPFAPPEQQPSAVTAHIKDYQRKGYQALIGQALARSEQLTIQTLSFLFLQQQLATLLPTAEQGSFRIILQPHQPSGYWAILLGRDTPFPEDTFARLREHSLTALNDAVLAALKTHLSERHQQLQETPEQLTNQRINQLFYGESTRTESFHDTLTHIHIDDVRAMLTQILDPASSVVIFQSPE